jgi:hypothetical protein
VETVPEGSHVTASSERLLFWTLVALAAVAAALMMVTTLTTGIGWDAGIDTLAAAQIRELDPSVGLRDAYEDVYSTSEFYGVLVQNLAEWLSLIAGQEQGLATSSLETYRWQGVVVVTLVLLATAAAGWAVTQVTESRVAGASSAAVTLSIPLVMGLSAVDFKDAPVAAGLLAVSSGLAIVSMNSPSRRRSFQALALVAMGAFVTLGVRIGAWPLVVALVAGSVVMVAVRAAFTRRWQAVLSMSATCAIGFILALVALYFLNPFARLDYIRWAYDAYATAQDFPWSGTVRTLGLDLDAAALPWWYAPVWFLAQMPVLVAISAIAGLAAWVGLVIRAGWREPTSAMAALTPFFVQGLALPAAVILSGAVLYDGIRHLLFAVVALGPISASLVVWLQGPSRPTSSRWLRKSPWLVVLVPVVSLVADVRWFPYQYAHINVVAQQVDGDRPWELDYWGVTVLEADRRLRVLGVREVAVLPEIAPQGTAEVIGSRDVADTPQGDGPIGVYSFRRGDVLLPAGCARAFTIERGGELLGEAVVCDRR